MSFDFSELPTKTEFENVNTPVVVPQPTDEELYENRKNRVQQRIVRFFGRTGGATTELKIRVGFLTPEDKAALISGVEGKGFACTESNGLMTIS